MNNEIPRRNQMQQWCPAEHAIREAMMRVEEMGAHIMLTEAINLLVKAKETIADYVDMFPPKVPLTPYGEVIELLKAMAASFPEQPICAWFGAIHAAILKAE